MYGKTIRFVSTLAFAAMLAACGGKDEAAAPDLSKTSTPDGAIAAAVQSLKAGDLKALVGAYDAGKTDEALRWHRKLFTLSRDLLSVATNPIPLKVAMKLLGRDTGELRLPLCPLDGAGEGRIAATLKAYGLLR